jgi:hypothetical protein
MMTRRLTLVSLPLSAVLIARGSGPAAPAEGQLTWAVAVALAQACRC